MCAFPTNFNLINLNGKNGFAINGIGQDGGYYIGSSVCTAGDINADGIADIIIGAPQAANDAGQNGAGQTYVIFGSKDGFSSSFNLTSLNGLNGFVINGIHQNDASGWSVSTAGDVNNDGISDIIIGAYLATQHAGQAYVVFGSKNEFVTPLNLASLNGKNGFTINGIHSDDQCGTSVSTAGDVNADGIADIIIGAPNANYQAGQSYVIFGSKSGFNTSLSLLDLNGSNGFAINGIHGGIVGGDQSGISVSRVGDVNGDGIDDIIVGANNADSGVGQGYVIFGSKNLFNATFNPSDLNGKNGYSINGISTTDSIGSPVSAAGDFNGDGIDDIILGAPLANSGDGKSYVVFGNKNGIGAPLNLADLNGKNGFVITDTYFDDSSAGSVSTTGDFNADGIDDIIIGAAEAMLMGRSYVIFGSKSSFNTTFNLDNLDGVNGFMITGISSDISFSSGNSVSRAGDVNADGVDDIIISALSTNGQAYVVFGQNTTANSDGMNVEISGDNNTEPA